jgi:hypothetical protein
VPTTPADRDKCSCRLLPCPARPSPNLSRVGIRDVTFGACSGFTRVTAHWIAQPPKAAFVARLRLGRLPSRAACQLPDQTDNYLGGTFLHWRCTPSGRTEKSGLVSQKTDFCRPLEAVLLAFWPAPSVPNLRPLAFECGLAPRKPYTDPFPRARWSGRMLRRPWQCIDFKLPRAAHLMHRLDHVPSIGRRGEHPERDSD